MFMYFLFQSFGLLDKKSLVVKGIKYVYIEDVIQFVSL